MDFSPDEGQQAVADVVTSVLERDNSWAGAGRRRRDRVRRARNGSAATASVCPRSPPR